ncbi:MAG: OmpA family protein [Flavobacteriales bacterium]|nr:OmpA family protein [Flavobacteriales bacterium]
MRTHSVKILSYFTFLIIFFGMGCATLAEQGDKLFQRQGYAEAVKKYQQALKKDTANVNAAIKMAESYLKFDPFKEIKEFENVEDLYANILDDPLAGSVRKLHDKGQLMKLGKYEQVKTILEIIRSKKPNDMSIGQFLGTMDKSDSLLMSFVLESIAGFENSFIDEQSFAIKNLDINSQEDDFSPIICDSGLVFTSARKKHSFATLIHAWNNKPFTNIYFSEGQEAQFSTPVLFAEDLQSKFHNGAVSFTADGRQMFYTQNNIQKGHVKRGEKKLINLKIFYSNKLNSGWDEGYKFEYNSNKYNCAHPSVSEDGQRLYFSSNMTAELVEVEGIVNYGGMDLYVCERLDFKWGKPVNLGPEMNTAGNEIFPFVHPDGSLYFSSDGHLDLVGLDIYKATKKDAEWQEPRNLGSPVNSLFDDFGITVSEDQLSGYFCSNRPGGQGNDDIYAFKREMLPKRLEVLVYDGHTQEPLKNASVKFSQAERSSVPMKTDEDGKVELEFTNDDQFDILASKGSYNEGTTFLDPTSYHVDSIPLIRIPLDKVLDFSDPCEIFSEVDKYNLDKISMNKISRKEIASLLNECTVQIQDQFYTKQHIKLKPISSGKVTLNGRVLDCNKEGTISGAKVFVREIDDPLQILKANKNLKAYTCADGKFSLDLPPGMDHIIGIDKFGLATFVDTIFAKPMSHSFSQDFHLCENKAPLEAYDFHPENILFDLNKADIKFEAALELDKIVQALKDNPDWELKLGSHTDSRGNDSYNLELSQNRADSTCAYIIRKGIDGDRIKSQGFGEKVLLNGCSNGVKCSEKEHQENRRTEFEIIEMEEDLLIHEK